MWSCPRKQRSAICGSAWPSGWESRRSALARAPVPFRCKGAFLLLAAACAWAATPVPEIVSAAKSAAQSNDTRAVERLIAKKSDVNAAEPDGTSALHWAVRNDDLSLVNVLIAARANVNVSNRYGATPLSLAAAAGNVKMLEALLK